MPKETPRRTRRAASAEPQQPTRQSRRLQARSSAEPENLSPLQSIPTSPKKTRATKSTAKSSSHARSKLDPHVTESAADNSQGSLPQVPEEDEPETAAPESSESSKVVVQASQEIPQNPETAEGSKVVASASETERGVLDQNHPSSKYNLFTLATPMDGPTLSTVTSTDSFTDLTPVRPRVLREPGEVHIMTPIEEVTEHGTPSYLTGAGQTETRAAGSGISQRNKLLANVPYLPPPTMAQQNEPVRVMNIPRRSAQAPSRREPGRRRAPGWFRTMFHTYYRLRERVDYFWAPYRRRAVPDTTTEDGEREEQAQPETDASDTESEQCPVDEMAVGGEKIVDSVDLLKQCKSHGAGEVLKKLPKSVEPRWAESDEILWTERPHYQVLDHIPENYGSNEFKRDRHLHFLLRKELDGMTNVEKDTIILSQKAELMDMEEDISLYQRELRESKQENQEMRQALMLKKQQERMNAGEDAVVENDANDATGKRQALHYSSDEDDIVRRRRQLRRSSHRRNRRSTQTMSNRLSNTSGGDPVMKSVLRRSFGHTNEAQSEPMMSGALPASYPLPQTPQGSSASAVQPKTAPAGTSSRWSIRSLIPNPLRYFQRNAQNQEDGDTVEDTEAARAAAAAAEQKKELERTWAALFKKPVEPPKEPEGFLASLFKGPSQSQRGDGQSPSTLPVPGEYTVDFTPPQNMVANIRPDPGRMTHTERLAAIQQGREKRRKEELERQRIAKENQEEQLRLEVKQRLDEAISQGIPQDLIERWMARDPQRAIEFLDEVKVVDARWAAERAAEKAGEKRKLRPFDPIPSGPSGTYGMVSEYFEDSSSDSDPSTPRQTLATPTEPSTKRVRIQEAGSNDETDTPLPQGHGSTSPLKSAMSNSPKFSDVPTGDDVIETPTRAPHETLPANTPSRQLMSTLATEFDDFNYEGSFGVPEDDSDTSMADASLASSSVHDTSMADRSFTKSPVDDGGLTERNTISNMVNTSPQKTEHLDTEHSNTDNLFKDEVENPPASTTASTESQSDSTNDIPQPVTPPAKELESGSTALSDSLALAKARAMAEKHKPKTPTGLRTVSMSASPPATVGDNISTRITTAVQDTANVAVTPGPSGQTTAEMPHNLEHVPTFVDPNFLESEIAKRSDEIFNQVMSVVGAPKDDFYSLPEPVQQRLLHDMAQPDWQAQCDRKFAKAVANYYQKLGQNQTAEE